MKFRVEKKTRKSKVIDHSNILGIANAIAAIEAHYLAFDGIVDYAVADAVFGGISGDYTIAIKVAGRNAAGSAGFETYYASGGPGASNQDRRDTVFGTTTSDFLGVSTAGSTTYDTGAVAFPASTTSRVFAVARIAAANDAILNIQSSAGTEYTATDAAATHQIPDHLAIGCRVNDALAAVANRYGAVKFIGLVLASVQVPDAELTAWLNGTDATDHIAGIDHYWVASDINGSEIPARIGTVALSLSGPTSSDLVAWAP